MDKDAKPKDKHVENTSVKVVDHIKIVDKSTGKEVLNKRG